ncbi:F-box only protein 4-like [Hemicordylus capensis]|uniref:F-box only protein 4-like n=1 Tax=Hemicordylus capensis TaxID=884348 RepID=UPI0023033E00|nr:F-box only protein 4-like [Hemicordylus capensis]
MQATKKRKHSSSSCASAVEAGNSSREDGRVWSLRGAVGPRLRGARLLGRDEGGTRAAEADEEEQQPSTLQALPTELKLYIMSFLTPKDVVYLGSTNHYWRQTVQDPLLWRQFLIRDLPSWHSFSWKSLPAAHVFSSAFVEQYGIAAYDYMEVYKKCCSWIKKHPPRLWPAHGLTTFFSEVLRSKVAPCFAMFGLGLEDLDESLEDKLMMTSPTASAIWQSYHMPFKQIYEIGPGIGLHSNEYQKITIITLYSKPSQRRRRAREVNPFPLNMLFYAENEADKTTQSNLTEVFKSELKFVDGFIYVASAEAHHGHERQTECAQLAALLDPVLGPPDRPLLILSCISVPGTERIPCVYMAHQLQLDRHCQPWMIQNIDILTLTGLRNGIEWLLDEIKNKKTTTNQKYSE